MGYKSLETGDKKEMVETTLELQKCIEMIVSDENGLEPVLHLIDSSYTLAYTIDIENTPVNDIQFLNGNTIKITSSKKPKLTFQPLDHDINFELSLIEKNSFSSHTAIYKFEAIGMKIYKNDKLPITDSKILHVQ